MLGLFGIILSLGLLMYLAYRGITVLVLAPLLATLAVLIGGDAPLLATYTQIFMQSAGAYVTTFFPLFLLGAVFGKLMDDSKFAAAIARWIVTHTGAERAILAVVLSCGMLTYGGVSLFVVAFAVFPIAVALFREAGVPKRLIPGTIALGSFTFTMTALPGTPAIQNLIPMPYFGTDAFAAPGLGIIAGLIMFGLGTAWLSFRHHRANAAGEGFDEASAGSLAPGERPAAKAFQPPVEGDRPLPSAALAFLPIFLVVGLNYLLSNVVIPAMNTGYLAQPEYGETTVDRVKGTWAIIIALTVSCFTILALTWRRLDAREAVNRGAIGSLLPIFNTASEVGYGAVIASLAAFIVLRDAVLGLSPDNPLISLAVAVNVLAGITGSASGGMSIALQTLGDTYAAMAQSAGISAELMHRVTAISSGGFDALPHCGAVITLLSICGLTHRQSYPDIFVVAIAIPVFALVTVIVLGSLFGSF